MNEELGKYMLIENASTTDEPSYRIVQDGFSKITDCERYLKLYHNRLLDASGLDLDEFVGKYIIAMPIGGEFEVTGRLG